MASSVASRPLPVNRRPSQSVLSDYLPNIHLGSFSQMNFDFDSPYSVTQRPVTEYYNPVPPTASNTFTSSRPSSNNDMLISPRATSGDWGRQTDKSIPGPTFVASQSEQIPSNPAQPPASVQQQQYRQEMQPLAPTFTSGSGLLATPPEMTNNRASTPSRQDGESTVRGTASMSGDDNARDQPIEGQLKEVINGHRRIESAEPAYQPTVSPRRISPNRDPSARRPAEPWAAFASPPGQQPQISPTPTGPTVRPQFVQKVVAPEEVCIECMMRDRDMADVDVSTPGVWERESDVWYEELVRKEQEEARLGIPVSNSNNKVRSQGGLLTEGNLKVWLTMNPKEPAARWQTLEKYVKSQAALLLAESEARDQAMRESRLRDARMKEAYFQLRRSTHDIQGLGILGADKRASGVKIRAPRPSSGDESQDDAHRRELTLLESGMILERVDLKREEKERRKAEEREEKEERRRSRKMSRASLNGLPSDGSSLYSGGATLAPNAPASQSQTSLLAPARVGRPLSALTPPRPPNARGNSLSSNESRGTPRFRGFRQWSGAWGSEASLHNSGSMMDMHLGLEKDREYAHAHPNGTPNGSYAQHEPATPETKEHDLSGDEPKHKKKGLGRLWKIMTGKDAKEAGKRSPQPEDLTVPLDPPPPISYLVNRSGGPSERVPPPPLSPSMQSSNGSFGQPQYRSASAPVPTFVKSTPPSAASSSMLPSPTSNRSPWRDSISEGRRDSAAPDDADLTSATEEMTERRDYLPAPGPSRASRYSMQQDNPRRIGHGPATSSSTGTFNPRRSGRESSVSSSIYKDLPPLPLETPSFPMSSPTQLPLPMPSPTPTHDRPMTTYDLDGPPRPQFASERRRQSFSGLIGNPVESFNKVLSRSRKNSELVPPRFSAVHYDEFGRSSASLGRLEDPRHYDMQHRQQLSSNKSADALNVGGTTRSHKTRSRFGFTSLFGRRSVEREDGLKQSALDGMGLAPSDGRTYARQTERYPAPRLSRSDNALRDSRASVVTFPRSSMASSRRLDSLIPQEDNFVAYRYPSEVERLDIIGRQQQRQ